MTNITYIQQRPSKIETLTTAFNLAIEKAKSNAKELWLLAPSKDISGLGFEEIIGEKATKTLQKDSKIIHDEITIRLISPHTPPATISGDLLSVASWTRTLELAEKYIKHKVVGDAILHASIDTDPNVIAWLARNLHTVY